MSFSQILDIVQTTVFVVGFVSLAYWIRGWITALKGVVDAQKATIDTQKVFIDNMSTLLTLTDAPKMLERYEAYKKITDHDKEATLKQYEKQFQEERNQLSNSDTKLLDGPADKVVEVQILSIIWDLIPFVPSENRQQIIDSATVPPRFKELLRRIAASTVDLPAEETRHRRDQLQKELDESKKSLDITVARLREQIKDIKH